MLRQEQILLISIVYMGRFWTHNIPRQTSKAVQTFRLLGFNQKGPLHFQQKFAKFSLKKATKALWGLDNWDQPALTSLINFESLVQRLISEHRSKILPLLHIRWRKERTLVRHSWRQLLNFNETVFYRSLYRVKSNFKCAAWLQSVQRFDSLDT